MSHLEELIQTLCSDGVEYENLGEVCSIVRGVTYSKSAEVNSTIGQKILRANNITLSTNTVNFDDVKVISDSVKLNSNQMLRKNDILICTASGSKAHIGKVAYIDQDLDCYFGGFMAVIRTNSTLLGRFMFHLLVGHSFSSYLENTLNSSTINNLNSTILSGFRVPIPPLPVQEEIVRILDTFTTLEMELEKQLEAELAARTKQYEHYRNALFEENQRSEKKTLGDVGKVCMCRRIYKEQTNSSGDVPFFKIGTFGKEPDAFISKELFEEYKSKYSYPKKGDILFSAAGTIGRTVIFDGSPSYFQDSNIVWIDNDETLVLNKYLNYFYSLGNWATSEGGTIARLYNDNISRTPIPVPPLEVQEQIVSILDRFEALVNDLKSGLPAEIALRRKQYEYYRDRLLTFKPKPTS